jgi:hypothetical protein
LGADLWRERGMAGLLEELVEAGFGHVGILVVSVGVGVSVSVSVKGKFPPGGIGMRWLCLRGKETGTADFSWGMTDGKATAQDNYKFVIPTHFGGGGGLTTAMATARAKPTAELWFPHLTTECVVRYGTPGYATFTV